MGTGRWVVRMERRTPSSFGLGRGVEGGHTVAFLHPFGCLVSPDRPQVEPPPRFYESSARVLRNGRTSNSTSKYVLHRELRIEPPRLRLLRTSYLPFGSRGRPPFLSARLAVPRTLDVRAPCAKQGIADDMSLESPELPDVVLPISLTKSPSSSKGGAWSSPPPPLLPQSPPLP